MANQDWVEEVEGRRRSPGRPRKYGSNAEKVKAYRERLKCGEAGPSTRTNDPGQGARRMEVALPRSAALKLDRIAESRGLTRSDILAELLQSAEDPPDTLDPDDLDELTLRKVAAGHYELITDEIGPPLGETWREGRHWVARSDPDAVEGYKAHGYSRDDAVHGYSRDEAVEKLLAKLRASMGG